jgi:hypothetical protein
MHLPGTDGLGCGSKAPRLSSHPLHGSLLEDAHAPTCRTMPVSKNNFSTCRAMLISEVTIQMTRVVLPLAFKLYWSAHATVSLLLPALSMSTPSSSWDAPFTALPYKPLMTGLYDSKQPFLENEAGQPSGSRPCIAWAACACHGNPSSTRATVISRCGVKGENLPFT